MSVNGRLLANRTGCLSWCSVSFCVINSFSFSGSSARFPGMKDTTHAKRRKKKARVCVCVCRSCLGSGALWWNSITDPCLSGTFPRFLFAAVLGTCSFFFSFFFFVFFYFDVVPSSPGDTELHSIRKRWTWTQKSLSDVTSLTGQSFFSTLSRMFCILFCYWVDHRRLLFPSVCRSTERPRRLLFRPQNCRISQSLSTVCVCVFCLCVGLRRVRGYISIYFQTILLPSFLLLLWVASLFIFVK